MHKNQSNKTFQRIMVCARFANDPKFKDLGNGKFVCNFGLLVNNEYGDADYIPSVAWGTKAKLINEYAVTGTLILCEGKIKSSTFKDSEKREQFSIQFELLNKGELTFLEKTKKREEVGNG